MAIGIGLHCWYCEHGPCNGQCRVEDSPLKDIYDLIREERERQDKKWGPQNHPSFTEWAQGYGIPTEDEAEVNCDAAFALGHGTWSHILIEELAEAVFAKTEEKRKEELIQVAAVAIAWIESIERNERHKI
jgi:hypothetical protein